MAKSTPRSTKGTPSKPTSAASAPASAGTPASASKKRVRVVEGEEASTPAKKGKAARKDKETPKEEEKVGGNGVERKDLRDKKPQEVETIRSRDAPAPQKGALKKSAAAAGKEDKAAKGKGKKVAQEEEEEVKFDEEEEEGDDDDDEEEIDFLAGFESGEDDGEDSSDEEMDDAEEQEQAKPKGKGAFKVEQLPKVKGASVQKKLESKEKKQHKTGVVYLGRIPKGFYEEEMRSYFSQFGEVTRLRLSRNKKTGASKHYAFIEFKYASVAEIVHETMDNYLLAGHILVCKVVPDDQVHPKLWVGANRKFRPVPKARQDAARRSKPKTEKQQEAIKARLLSREDKKRKQLAELGIEYDFAGYAGKKVEGAEEEKAAEPEAETPAKGTPKGKKARKSAGGNESATKKKAPRKSK
ncbi:nucleolar protein [Rhodotorula kratochvilovae]